MNNTKRTLIRKAISFTGGVLLPLLSVPWASATPLTLDQVPLFTQNAAKSNLILAIDDSGSMEFEFLFDSNDGALWWNTTNQSFVSSGALNFNTSGSANSTWKRYMYQFPNGTGTGEKAFSDSSNFYAVPPFAQFAFGRSSEFNKMYYNPNVTYSPWPSARANEYDPMSWTAAKSDPATGSSNFNLTIVSDSTDNEKKFTVFNGLVIPSGTEYHDGSSWVTAASDLTIPTTAVSDGAEIGIKYYPATYYVTKSTGSYDVNGTTGSCASTDSSHYSIFEANPSSLTGTDVDALSFDGTCLTKVEVKQLPLGSNSYDHDGSRTDCVNSSTCTYAEEIQNFANWYSYFRRRHLALRSGLGQAFNGLSSIRTGIFTINSQTDVTMRDMDNSTESLAFFDQLYDIVGRSGGTPNRSALKHAGEQFMRTDTGAPITEACQKNFTLFFTDGYTSISGTQPTVTDMDNDEGAPYADSFDNTFADIAMHYYKTNLRGDLDTGKVPVLNGCNATTPDEMLDCNTNLHMNTYTVGLGAKGTIFGVTHDKVADAYATNPTWVNTNTDRDATQIDDLYHAAVNGRGEIYNAESADDLQTQLQEALLSIQSQKGSSSSVTFNTATVESFSNVFLALFNSSTWSGDLLAFKLTDTGDVVTTNPWSAADQLDDGTPSATSRVILTYDDVNGIGIPFRWNNVTDDQKLDLNAGSVGTALGAQHVLNFIRGDRTNEGSGKFRVRESLLGDIINGSPVFIGKPDLRWPDVAPFPIGTVASGEKYSKFKADNSTRGKVVYVGANDGMLHGFDASTDENGNPTSSSGEEVLAYIPNLLFSDGTNEGLHYLADPLYQHRYYLDHSPAASDVHIKTPSSPTASWRTVLVGGLRGGGKGLYALDVTNPSTFSESGSAPANTVLWEFTHSQDLGYTFSKPTIAMMENGRWAAIFGNGYNSTSEEAKLFIVFLDGGIDGEWTDGSGSTDLDYIILPTDGSTSNGMATPRVIDFDGNGAADRVYVGDLQGNMWAFDLSDASTLGNDDSVPSWGSAYTSGSTPVPLFTAKDGTGGSANRQPITTKPSVSFHPDETTNGGNSPNLMIYFGTGKFLESTDISDTSDHTFYGVWDKGSDELDRGDLQEQTVSSLTAGGETFRGLSDDTVNGSEKGWYIDLPATGERSVVDSSTRGNNVFFNTWIPSTDACSAGGSGFLMSVSKSNGGEPDNPAFDVDGDGDVDDNDTASDGSTEHNPAGEEFVNGLPAASKFLGNKQYTPGTGSEDLDEDGGGVRDVEDLGGIGSGRLSWQELSN